MYSPKIDEELIRELYLLKQQTGKPMTKLASEAVRSFIQSHKTKEPDNDRRN